MPCTSRLVLFCKSTSHVGLHLEARTHRDGHVQRHWVRSNYPGLADHHIQPLADHRQHGMPLLAPNGQPSKLNAHQWAQVRTPAFKQWFGDWEVDLRKPVPITKLNSRQWVGDEKTLTALARQVYTRTLQGSAEFNADFGQPIAFTSEGKGEAFSPVRDAVDAQVVEALRTLVSRAAYVSSAPPEAKRAHDSKAFHTLVAPLEANGRTYAVKIVVREALRGPEGVTRQKFYDIAVLRKTMAPAANGVAVSGDAARPSSTEANVITVRQLLETVNGPPPQASTAVDANGEPLPSTVERLNARGKPLRKSAHILFVRKAA